MTRFAVPFQAMGTQCQIQLAAGSFEEATVLASSAIEVVRSLERDYSRYLPKSLLSLLNSSAGTACGFDLDDQTHALMLYAASAYEQSEGLFDVTSGVLRRVWDFKKAQVPNAETVAECLSFVGWPRLAWHGQRKVYLPLGFELDFGGFVKEYAADAAVQQLRQAGIAEALVDLGGDVAVVGCAWPLAIKNPASPACKLVQLRLEAGALATSGNYERCFTYQGRRYSHILNPLTGWPVATPASVSVVADSCLVAGTVSTVAMLAGEAGCIAWLNAIGLPFCCVFNDGRIVNTL